MEDKMKRESRKCLEKFFKKNDILGSGSISPDAMKEILHAIIPIFPYDEELNHVMAEYVTTQKYTAIDPTTKKLQVKYVDHAIDFPSAMAIAVHFLTKRERRDSNAFAGKGLIRFTDLPSTEVIQVKRQDSKRRLY